MSFQLMGLERSVATACLVCGVDSTPILMFFLFMVGSGLVGALFFLLWSIARGDFRDAESVKYDIFEMERKG